MLESLVTFPSRAASRVKEEDREGEGPSACCGRLQSGTFLCQRTWVRRLCFRQPPRTVKLPCLALLTAGRPPDNSNALETSLDRLGAPVLIGESRRTTPVEVGVRAPHLLLAPLSFFVL